MLTTVHEQDYQCSGCQLEVSHGDSVHWPGQSGPGRVSGLGLPHVNGASSSLSSVIYTRLFSSAAPRIAVANAFRVNGIDRPPAGAGPAGRVELLRWPESALPLAQQLLDNLKPECACSMSLAESLSHRRRRPGTVAPLLHAIGRRGPGCHCPGHSVIEEVLQ